MSDTITFTGGIAVIYIPATQTSPAVSEVTVTHKGCTLASEGGESLPCTITGTDVLANNSFISLTITSGDGIINVSTNPFSCQEFDLDTHATSSCGWGFSFRLAPPTIAPNIEPFSGHSTVFDSSPSN